MRNSSEFYEYLHQWLVDVKRHELTQAVELIEHAKVIARTIESIPEEKVIQFIENFKYDLYEFYHQNHEQVKHSTYLALMNESFWVTMANITDKSQVEWAELCEDFSHNGDYYCGDVVGFGLLECKNCHKTLKICHLTEIDECLHCGHKHFSRKSLTP